MSGVNKVCAKRSREKNRFAFPDDLEIPESALKDRKFVSSYVNIFNDPRVYKRRRMNGERTSSRFDVDHNHQHIKVVFNEPIVKRKSILANTQSAKDDSGIRKSVSFVSKVTFIDSIDLDGVSSDWTDIEIDESQDKTKTKCTKCKSSKNGKLANKLKKETASNDTPSSKSKKKAKDKSSTSSLSPPSNKNGHKPKSTQKGLFKFKITKPFRKFGRTKDKKVKHLQKKFGPRMFKAFVQVKRSFNLKSVPEKVTIPLEKITLKATDVTTPKKSVPSIQDFLIGQMTKKVKVSLTPVQGDDTNTADEPMISDTDIVQSEKNELNSIETTIIDSSRRGNDVQSDSPVDRQVIAENTETNQNIALDQATDSTNSDHQSERNYQTIKINGDVAPEERIASSDEKTVSCNDDTKPSPEVVESSALPNIIDKITCNMYYNTNNDETVTMNGQMIESTADSHHMDLVDNISTINVSFSMPTDTKSLADDILGCDASEIASIQLKLDE